MEQQEKYHIREERPDNRKWFTQIPNIIEEKELDPYAYRLYAHLRKVAGEDGACYESTPTIAKNCNMSTGSVSKAKQTLADEGLIIIKEIPHPGKPRHDIVIVDIWEENYKRYLEIKAERDAKRQRSQGELQHSPGEIKKNHEEDIYKDSVPSSLCPQGGDDEKPKEKPKSVLHPQSESDQLLFDLINKQRKAKGWGPAKKFTNLAIAEKYRSAACNLDGHLETAIQCAFTNIGSIALKDVVNYVAKWKPGGPKRENSRRNSRQNVDPSWKPGNPTGLGEWSDADLAYFASLTFDDAVDAPG